MQVEARAEVEVPEHLISAEHLDQLMAEHQPRFLPTATSISKEDIPVIPSDEPSEQIMQFKLSNGIKVNARRTLNEPKAAMLRMIAAGDTPLIRPSHSVSLLHSSPIVGHCAVLETKWHWLLLGSLAAGYKPAHDLPVSGSHQD